MGRPALGAKPERQIGPFDRNHAMSQKGRNMSNRSWFLSRCS